MAEPAPAAVPQQPELREQPPAPADFQVILEFPSKSNSLFYIRALKRLSRVLNPLLTHQELTRLHGLYLQTYRNLPPIHANYYEQFPRVLLLEDLINQPHRHRLGMARNEDPVRLLEQNLSHSEYFAQDTVQLLAEWIEHHRVDERAAENVFDDVTLDSVDGVEQMFDAWNKRRRRLAETPSYWDSQFYQKVRGEAVNGVNGAKEPAMGNVMRLLMAAHLLGIDGIVELGAKLICNEITQLQPYQVRLLFGHRPLNLSHEANVRLLRATEWAYGNEVHVYEPETGVAPECRDDTGSEARARQAYRQRLRELNLLVMEKGEEMSDLS